MWVETIHNRSLIIVSIKTLTKKQTIIQIILEVKLQVYNPKDSELVTDKCQLQLILIHSPIRCLLKIIKGLK